MDKKMWTAFPFYCPYCGKESQAHLSENGTMKSVCARCRAVVVRRRIGRRHTQIDLYASEKEA